LFVASIILRLVGQPIRCPLGKLLIIELFQAIEGFDAFLMCNPVIRRQGSSLCIRRPCIRDARGLLNEPLGVIPFTEPAINRVGLLSSVCCRATPAKRFRVIRSVDANGGDGMSAYYFLNHAKLVG